ncbi:MULTISPECIES: hypothetical protein [unclassified Mesorhizobium]|uniref:hypothetical protein n=1 Tax=unclassified Mesorhizobium TaxID=325217 RepID=UPI001FEF9030|nr:MULTISPECIES: hypothetical protein [unclassified Mesorhizobium]
MEPAGKDIAGFDVVASEIDAGEVAAILRCDLSRWSTEAAADVEHSIRSGERKLPCQLSRGGAAANVKLVYGREVLGGDRAFGLPHGGKTIANTCDQAASRVVVSNL